MGFKENLKSELEYSGMLVKELAAKSGVNKYSIDNYLNARGQIPSIEAGVRIARALGVSAEFLVTGEKGAQETSDLQLSKDIRTVVRLTRQFDDKKRKFVIDFIKWLKFQKFEDYD
jgi:transcriptional regulator with XRE-family HTH domain